jgi:hypothetical protein
LHTAGFAFQIAGSPDHPITGSPDHRITRFSIPPLPLFLCVSKVFLVAAMPRCGISFDVAGQHRTSCNDPLSRSHPLALIINVYAVASGRALRADILNFRIVSAGTQF